MKFGPVHLADAEGFESLWCGDNLTTNPRMKPLAMLVSLSGNCQYRGVTFSQDAPIRHTEAALQDFVEEM